MCYTVTLCKKEIEHEVAATLASSKPYTVSGPTTHPLPPLSSSLPPLPPPPPPFLLLPLPSQKFPHFLFNPSYSLPIAGFSNNYLFYLFLYLPFRNIFF